MPTAYILVGVPGSGKSTWIENQKWSKDCAVVSTDYHVEQYAKEKGKTYSEVFNDYMSTAVELMVSDVHDAMEKQKDIIWDQTSTTISTRAKKIRMLEGYTKIAVVFNTPKFDELNDRLQKRALTGKIIPSHVMASMINGFEHPTLEEGFDQIWHAC